MKETAEGDKYHINKMLISSFDYLYVWKEECQKMGAQVIELHGLLEREGIICQEEFYKLEYSEKDFSCINFDERKRGIKNYVGF